MSLWRALYSKLQYSTCPDVADIDEAVFIIQTAAKEAHSSTLTQPIGKVVDYWLYPGRVLPTMLGERLGVRGKITRSIDDINMSLKLCMMPWKNIPPSTFLAHTTRLRLSLHSCTTSDTRLDGIERIWVLVSNTLIYYDLGTRICRNYSHLFCST